LSKRGAHGSEKKKRATDVQSTLRTTSTQTAMQEVTEDLVKRASREIINMKYVTPFMLSQKLNVKVSLAKKILRILAERGIVRLYSPGKRDPLYVPAKSS